MPEEPRRRLPAHPSHEHLRKEAKRLAKAQDIQLATAQRQLAADYGFTTWAALMRAVDGTASALAPPPLAAAAARADEAEVRELLARGEDADGARGEVGMLLWSACESDAPAARRIAVVTLLLDAGASPRRSARDGATALHAAARRGPLALVELLIRRGALTWLRDKRGKDVLAYARKGTATDRDAIVALLDRPVIKDARFRAAVKAIHAGDVMALERLLDAHPALLHERAVEPDCYPQDYFRDPKLFWFVANNPTLMRNVPANIATVARTMVARGVEPADLDYTLELVMSCGEQMDAALQIELIEVLLGAGAAATEKSVVVALAHGCLAPIEQLLARGTPLTAPMAAALGRDDALARLLPRATPEERQAALSMAVVNGHSTAVRLCLEAGADPNQRVPVHRHAMPLHQAALRDDVETMKLLVAHGARLDERDTLWDGTPLGWAVHNGCRNAEAYLRALQEGSG